MKQVILSGLVIGAFSLSSCTSINPYTGQEQTSNSLKGAAIGAVGGALLGNLIGDDTEGTLLGAGVGSLIGLGVGEYMDTQEAKIRAQLVNSGVSVTRRGNELILNMPSDITFNAGQSSLQPRFRSSLDSVALVFKEFKKTGISISGFTDSDGSTAYNLRLSQDRAYAVSNYISSKGVSSSRIQAKGVGESYPIASNATAAGKAKNRRVEIRISPQSGQF